MGNCLKSNSSSPAMVWAGDDWGSLTETHRNSNNNISNNDVNGEERQRLLGGNSFREVKIKITKRELEELTADVHMQGLTMEGVLSRLVNNYNYEDNYEPNYHHHYSNYDHHHHHWKPALQSIPEVN